jgi:hypothetical protein
MKALAIINTELLPEESIRNKETIDILGTSVTTGVVDITRPNFDVKNPQNDDFVLVRVDAFSCNYRDKALIVKAAINMKNNGISAKPVSFFWFRFCWNNYGSWLRGNRFENWNESNSKLLLSIYRI